VLPDKIRKTLETVSENLWDEVFEIRLRAGKMISLSFIDGERFIGSEKIDQQDISKTLSFMSQNSIYIIQEEIKYGFITLRGGHRVGLAGRVICEDGKIQNLKNFSSLNIRIARQIKGCADEILKYVIKADRPQNTLIVSPPRCGKTTILRDIVRQVSNSGKTVGLIDERSEIAACFHGIAQNDVGLRTDILDNCPKAKGMMMMIRSMGPNIIATDEIGTSDDAKAIMEAINAGVGVIATAHGRGVEDLMFREGIKELLRAKVFERIIFLCNRNGPGTIREVLDGELKIIQTPYSP
jgi:stage III sporulation protein AA